MDDGRSEGARAKYDAIADTYSTRFADPDAFAAHQVGLLASWGRQLLPGASVLEIGCADGLVTSRLAHAGFRVTAIDLSPRMIDAAAERLRRDGVSARFVVSDIDTFDLADGYDAILGCMRTFYAYLPDPGSAVRRLARGTRAKLIVDLDPRRTPIRVPVGHMRSAGFDRAAWRPFFVPQRVRVPGPIATALHAAERVPLVRSAPLRWKFAVAVMGERRLNPTVDGP